MKWIKSIMVAGALLLFANGAAHAQTTPAGPGLVLDLKAIGAGVVIVGAAMGIGGLAKAAVESMSRQPEIAGNIQTAMIIAAALIEGVTFFALVIIILQVILGR
jgi:F-type H+-transporting ATPase subunit c